MTITTLILLVNFLILDCLLYCIVPYSYRIKFPVFWRQSMPGSGIIIWIDFIIKLK